MIPITDELNEYFDQTFEQLDLAQQKLTGKNFENCTFTRCDLTEADLSKSTFCDCVFNHCNLSNINIKLASFRDTVFNHTKIIGVNWTAAAWPSIKLISPIQFFQCDISHGSFMGLYLLEINIIECQAINTDFREACLKAANFSHTDLAESLFINCDLTKTDFSFALNYSINVSVNRITQAKFMLPEAISLLNGLDIELVDMV